MTRLIDQSSVNGGCSYTSDMDMDTQSSNNFEEGIKHHIIKRYQIVVEQEAGGYVNSLQKNDMTLMRNELCQYLGDNCIQFLYLG